MKKEKYICPVCGFDGLEEPAYDNTGEPSFEICSCCGFEFGFDDYSENKTFEQYRDEWIRNGAKWEMKEDKPQNWDLESQLNNIKSKRRLFEEKVVEFFVSQIPEINNFVVDTFKYYDVNESAGMYIVLPDIIRYLTSCVKNEDYKKVKEFFRVYNVFYDEFAKEYEFLMQNENCDDLENILSYNDNDELAKKNFEFIKQTTQNETMYNLNAVELFEILDTYEDSEKQKVIPLMSEKLQKEYREIY